MCHSVIRPERIFVTGLFLFWSMSLGAAAFVPQSISGSASVNFGYVSSEGSASDTAGISGSMNLAGYFWQPWFATSTFGLTVGLTRSATEGGSESSAAAVSGRVGLDVFPRSRFPFSFSLNRSDSQLDYVNNFGTNSSNKFVNTHILMRLSYIGRRSLLADISWVHNQNESRFDDSKADSLNASLRFKKESHFFHATSSYSTNKSKSSNIQPESFIVGMSHDYVPGTELSVSSSGSYLNNQTKTIGTTISSEVSQAGSFFSWRPEHKPYTFSGGARVSSSTSSVSADQEVNDFSINVGMDYRFTTRFKMIASLAAGATDANSLQSVRTAEALSLSYNSDQFLVFGFNYSWNTVGSLSNSNTETDGETEQTGAVSLALGHRVMQSWALSRRSSFNTSISQTGGSSVNDESDGTNSLSHGANAGFSVRGSRGTTFLSTSVSDSRSYSDKDSVFQMVNFVVSRNQVINRLSSLSGNLTAQSTKQKQEAGTILTSTGEQAAGEDVSTSTKSLFATANYMHGRLLGVYSLRFTSSLSFQRSSNESGDGKDTIDWQNRFEYRVGLLDTAFLVRLLKTSGGDPTTSINFRATRTF